MKLTEVEIFTTVKFVFERDSDLLVRLVQSGLYDGDSAQVIRSAPFGGPLLIKVGGREIAISRKIAEKIIVEIQCELR